jgi:hypothetical protein
VQELVGLVVDGPLYQATPDAVKYITTRRARRWLLAVTLLRLLLELRESLIIPPPSAQLSCM